MRRIYLPLLFVLNAFMVTADNFSEAMNTIVSNNLSVKYNEASDAAKLEELKGENILEAPEVEFEHVWGAENIGRKWNLSVSQSFDWPGVYEARKESIRTSGVAMQYLRESAMLDVRAEVKTALIDLIYTRRKIDAISGLSESMGKLVEIYRTAVEKRELTRLDYNKAVLEKIDMDRELKSLKGELAVLVSQLEALNGGKSVSSIIEKLGDEYPGYTLSDLVPNTDMVKERDPQYAAAMASIDANKSLVKVEKLNRFPGFSLGYVHEYEMGEKFNGFSIGITLPFLTGKNKLKAARLQTEALNYEADMQLTERVAELNGIYRQAVALHDLIEQSEPVIMDGANFELLKKALDGGQISLLTYLQEVHYFRAAQSDFLDTVYQYQLALAKLSRYH